MKQIVPRVKIPRMTKASIIIDQLQPSFGSSDRSIMGKITVPVDEPVRAIPIAKPRSREKSFATTATGIVPAIAVDSPPKIPKHSMKCQYFVHTPSSIMLRNVQIDPKITKYNGPHLSKMGPACTPAPKARKM